MKIEIPKIQIQICPVEYGEIIDVKAPPAVFRVKQFLGGA